MNKLINFYIVFRVMTTILSLIGAVTFLRIMFASY